MVMICTDMYILISIIYSMLYMNYESFGWLPLIIEGFCFALLGLLVDFGRYFSAHWILNGGPLNRTFLKKIKKRKKKQPRGSIRRAFLDVFGAA